VSAIFADRCTYKFEDWLNEAFRAGWLVGLLLWMAVEVMQVRSWWTL